MAETRSGPTWGSASVGDGLMPQRTNPEFRAGGARWRDVSERLYNRLRGDVSDTYDALEEVYPSTWVDYAPRPVAYVPWLSRQIANIYTTEPRIEYVDPDSGKPLDATVVAEIGRLREAAGVTESILASHEETAAPGNGTVWVVPVVRKRAEGDFVSVRTIAVPAHDQAVRLADHPESDAESDVTAWRVRLPVPGAVDMTAIACVTREAAVWESGAPGELAGKGIWPTKPGAEAGSATNPIGEIPVAVLRWSKPRPGEFWSPAREDVLLTARAIDIGETDFGHVARLNGFGQWFGKDLKLGGGKVKMGPATLIEGEGKDSDLKCISPTPALDGTLKGNEAYLKAAVGTQDLNAGPMLGSSGITAQAKLVELSDRDGLRQRHVKMLARVEQRIYDLMRAWINHLRGVEVLPPARLIVEYSTPPLALDPMHAVQAAERRVALGLSDPYSERATQDRCSIDEAKMRVRRSLKRTRKLGVMPKPGGSGPLGQASEGAPPSKPVMATEGS